MQCYQNLKRDKWALGLGISESLSCQQSPEICVCVIFINFVICCDSQYLMPVSQPLLSFASEVLVPIQRGYLEYGYSPMCSIVSWTSDWGTHGLFRLVLHCAFRCGTDIAGSSCYNHELANTACILVVA